MNVGLLMFSCLAIVIGVSGLAFQLALRPPAERPRFGRRGRNRMRALRRHGWFRLAEPALRYMSATCEPMLPRGLSGKIERRLAEAGYPVGLTASELAGASVVAAAFFTVTLLALDFQSLPWPLVPLGAIAVASAPLGRISAEARRRGKAVTRRLPTVLELIVMCMGAGLDLPRSLVCVVESASDPSEPIVEELDAIVRELELGRTRKEALRSFADRVPTPEVNELVNTVVQSEDKGVPLSRALTIQSRTLKLRRSMAAERAASGAALMLVGPMSLIFLCVIALLLGPVLIRTTAGGLGA